MFLPSFDRIYDKKEITRFATKLLLWYAIVSYSYIKSSRASMGSNGLKVLGESVGG